MFRSLLQPMWDLTIHPLWGPSVLADTSLGAGSDTICNSPSPLLADIFYFSPLRIVVSLMVLKCICWGEASTPLYGMFRSSLQPMWDLTTHLLGDLASSLAYRPVLALKPFVKTHAHR